MKLSVFLRGLSYWGEFVNDTSHYLPPSVYILLTTLFNIESGHIMAVEGGIYLLVVYFNDL